ncbi:MAG: DUF4286 family protein [Tatlockia sp.]|nr:DUF4286 family protein [Tatlockia sp.]
MVIYEVNLAINEEVYTQFKLWLKKHAIEMLQFPGFIQANILKPEKEEMSGKEKLTVQYQLKNRKALEVYFEKFAPIMRQEGINLFKDKFSAERRIYEVQEMIIK